MQANKLAKAINTEADVEEFSRSEAFARLWSLLAQFSQLISADRESLPTAEGSTCAQKVCRVLATARRLDIETEVTQGPRRFGDPAFRKWQDKLVTEGVRAVQDEFADSPYVAELTEYFCNAFGSRQRLDYGTGHELSFLAFLGGIVGPLINSSYPDPHLAGRHLVRIWLDYAELVQRLISKYSLEPAGSHGVWGLDDHFHALYVFGSAQIVDLTRADGPNARVPTNAVLDPTAVHALSESGNLYFRAVQFILSVKRGPFFEHSPTLYDVTGVPTWHKIHRGMLKMYRAEVLMKRPIVQHFLFGELYPWRRATQQATQQA